MRKAIEQKAATPDYTVTLTARELTLVRVALIQRLDRLKAKLDSWEGASLRLVASYDDTRALLADDGKLATTTIAKAGRP